MIDELRRRSFFLSPRILLFFVSILVSASITSKWLHSNNIVSKKKTFQLFLSKLFPNQLFFCFQSAISSEQIRNGNQQNSRTFSTYAVNPRCYFRCKEDQLPVSVYKDINGDGGGVCPGYFSWIHEDLKPWKETGITKEMVERAKDLADIRVTIFGGKLYVEKYKSHVFQTRDVVTVWGLLQLLRLYPGKLPDMDLMFEFGDKPVILKSGYGRNDSSRIPPPLFHYCGDELTYDIVFPDWSFWGWYKQNKNLIFIHSIYPHL